MFLTHIQSLFFVVVFYTVIQLTVEPGNLTIPEGKLAAFECYAGDAKPRAEVTWYKDSVRINADNNPRLHTSNLTGTLMIREVQASDVGLYHCVAENVAGTVMSREARLTLVPG